MKMFRYVSYLYLRYFVLIIFALMLFFSGLDYMQNASRLTGFNIKILYIFYKSMYAFNLLFPIALVFSMIVAKLILMRSNTLVSLYALGYSKKAVLRPFFWIAALLTLVYIGMHFTPFVNSEIDAKMLLEHQKGINTTQNLFVKYNNSFVYISKLIPYKKEAKDIRIYETKGSALSKIIYGKSAVFDGEKWTIPNARIIIKPQVSHLSSKGLRIEQKRNVKTLYGFKPKILSSVFEGKQFYTIMDAYNAWQLLKTQHLETSKVRSILYNMTIAPFFAPFLIIIFFLILPPHARSINMLWISFILSGSTLFIWGLIYLLYRISLSGVIIPELGTVLAVGLLGIGALYSYLFRSNSF